MNSSQLVPQVLSEFAPFPKLPLEIRRNIWVYALPGPRIINLLYDEVKEDCWSVASIPETLHVCQESRIEALRYYILTFGSKVAIEESFEAVGRVYFDFAIDSVNFSSKARPL